MSARAPLPCPECEGLRTRVLVVVADPDPPLGDPSVLRVRACLDCGELLASAESLRPTVEIQRRLAELLRDRTADRRAVRKSLARVAVPGVGSPA